MERERRGKRQIPEGTFSADWEDGHTAYKKNPGSVGTLERLTSQHAVKRITTLKPEVMN